MYFTKEKLKNLHTNQRLLVEELLKNGIIVNPVDLSIELIEAEYKWHKEYILDRFCSNTPYVQAQMTSDKILAKNILIKNWINTQKWAIFDSDQKIEAIKYTQENLIFPVVIKPNWWSHGDNIYLDIQNLNELNDQIDIFLDATKKWMPFIIEEQFEWEEYRIFIAKNWDYAVLHRERPFVIWNWIDTLKKLAEDESNKRITKKINSLCPILIDDFYLLKQWIDINYIPQKNQKVYVRNTSNIAKWWYSHNVTNNTHSSVIKIAKDVLCAFEWLPYAWIDFMCSDITKKQDINNYTIIEVNTNPWIAMHMLPWDNKPINIAKTLVKLMFPEIKLL